MRKPALHDLGRGHFLSLMIHLQTVLLLFCCSPEILFAQVASNITSSGLNTTISQNGNTFNIMGGTRPANGPNLFHSFENFSVSALDTARFLNTTPELATSNILGRVTGGNVSSLFGTIDTLSYGNANLYLMNPAGIVFGPNATLNVGGSVTFTTANSLRLSDSTGVFHADPASTSVLTSAPVAAFGFLGSNPAAITAEGSSLSVPSGQSLNFVAGDIMIGPSEMVGSPPQAAQITAPEGQINLVSVAAAGEVLVSDFQLAMGMAGGSITLGLGTLLDVSGNAGGTVRIRGGSFVMDQAAISADTINANGAPIAIDINVAEDVSITNLDVPALTARTTGAGNAGEITISSESLDVTTLPSENFLFSAIDTHTSGPGNAGKVTISTETLTVGGDPISGASLFIDSGTSGPNPGRGGDVTINATSVELNDTLISTGNFVAFFQDEGGAGIAGNVNITANSLHMTLSQIVTDSSDFVTPTGISGDITIAARDLRFDESALSTTGNERSGAVTITADQLIATGTQIQSITNLSSGGEVRITGDVLEFRDGGNIASSTMGDGHAGPITITATDHLVFSDSGQAPRPSGIFNNSFGENGSLGNAGDVVITTPSLELSGGARINTSTATSGRGGNVTINTSSLSASGEIAGQVPEPLFSLGSTQPSGIFTVSVGGECAGPCGNAGDVSITTGSLSMGTGSQINSGTSSSGQGGNISINATSTIAMSGTLSTGQPGGIQSRSIGQEPDAGSGGNIALTAGQSVTISNGAAISASSTSPGDAGNISINAGQRLDMRDSSITAQASQASGGNIDVRAIDRVRLINSTISTSVQGNASTAGGNITIDPNSVILQNSQILATAVQGSGGNISIFTPLFLADASSVVDASSQFGLSGTVTIQSPTSNLSSTLGVLSSKPRQAQSLVTQRCAALADGQASSFVVAGREQLPPDPGSWLASPPMLAWLDDRFDGFASAIAPTAARDVETVSLRRLTPAGFLTANFADSEATGCHS